MKKIKLDQLDNTLIALHAAMYAHYDHTSKNGVWFRDNDGVPCDFITKSNLESFVSYLNGLIMDCESWK